jgi:phosphoribosylamine--glycine ligase
MKILVIGSGGREHAICDKFYHSKDVKKVFAMPGNAGIATIAECILSVNVKNHLEVIDFCQKNAVDLVFVGPEQPLVDGLVDDLKKAGIRAFGASKYCAQLEGSKDFMKKIAVENHIPTAKYQTFTEFAPAFDFAQKIGFPCVIKADGLAAGKGVVIAQNEQEFSSEIKEFFAGKFGEASKKVIVEEFLTGLEVSHFVISDGKNFVNLGCVHDHKKVGEGETGLNTGGMGTFTPSPFVDEKTEEFILQKMVRPTLLAMEKSGNPFVGVLFTGVILTENGPKLLEFNTRFGDPETQILLPRIKSDFAQLIIFACNKNLDEFQVEFDQENKLVCVVVAAKGYPENYKKGGEINLNNVNIEDVKILHAGTKLQDGKIVANGGRVLNIIAKDKSFEGARNKAYEAFKQIEFDDGFVRSDIAKKAI